MGDDRAARGLAGIAVKAGARSALASLWLIDHEATSQLVHEFYRQLQDLRSRRRSHFNEPNRRSPVSPFAIIRVIGRRSCHH
ncbi:MAG TPA: CHAT domain-containing protein [Nitrospira sp.]|nr:CHAT domain-containing protein [Nitrospira sp.]